MQEINSQNAIKIIDRLKKSLKIKTDIELSEFLNIKPNTISTWKKRNTVDHDAIISICELYELDLNEIFLGKNASSTSDNTIPLICKDAHFQYAKESDLSTILEILPKYNVPFASEKARIFQAGSNNMFPIIEENSFVICEPSSIENFNLGDIAVIVSNKKGFMINRVFKDINSSNFLLSSEDEYYPGIKIDADEIKEIWSIIGCLSYNKNGQSKLIHFSKTLHRINKYLDRQNTI